MSLICRVGIVFAAGCVLRLLSEVARYVALQP